MTEIRRVVGAVGWLARQTRPDLLAATSILAQSTSDPRVSHLVAANSLIKAARQDADFQLVFSSGAGIDIDDCRILCSSDSAFANVDDVSGRGQVALRGVPDGHGEARLQVYAVR